MHHPFPIKAASPRSISITSTTGPVLIPSWAQRRGERDGFKFPAHPHQFISSSAHRISTSTIETTSLPPSIPTRRAPGSQQASASIPHPAWIRSQKSPARPRSWGTPRRCNLFALQPPPPHLRICIALPRSHRASLHPSPGSCSPSLVPAAASASLAQLHPERSGVPTPRLAGGLTQVFLWFSESSSDLPSAAQPSPAGRGPG